MTFFHHDEETPCLQQRILGIEERIKKPDVGPTPKRGDGDEGIVTACGINLWKGMKEAKQFVWCCWNRT